MRTRSLSWTIALLLVWPQSVSAQGGVQRERHVFIGNSLEIEVLVDVPGTLRLIQGRAGEIAVTARAVSGTVGSGLTGADDGRLQLTAVGAARVEYLVAVPEGARVRVRLPGKLVAETLGTLQKTAVYTWDQAGQRVEIEGEPGGEPGGSER